MRTFNDAWIASQPKEVQAIMKLGQDPIALRGAPALDLSLAGVPIDLAIVVYGWQPYYVHLERTVMGCPYVGSLRGVGADPAGAASTGQAPFWVPQPWDYTKVPKGCLPTVFIDTDDDAGNMRRLDALYPPPAAPIAPPPTTINPLGFAFGVQRDYTAPDGTAYKNCWVYAANGQGGANGDKYTSPVNSSKFILGITKFGVGETKLWYQIS